MSGAAFGAQCSTVRHVTKFVPCMQAMTVKCKSLSRDEMQSDLKLSLHADEACQLMKL